MKIIFDFKQLRKYLIPKNKENNKKMADQEEQLTQFTDITGATTERAQFFLESSNYNLEVIFKVMLIYIFFSFV